MKKALITGGSGFLGNALRGYLIEQEYEVFTFDTSYGRNTKGHLRGSVIQYEDIESAVFGMDVVFHLAGLLGTTELLTQNLEAVDVNVKGTLNVLEACLRHGVKTVFYPTKPNEWLNTYSITKRAGEEFAMMYASLRKLDIRILRWLNAYGPGQKAYPIRKAVPVMIIQALAGLDIEVWGTGNQPVDLIFSEDLARNTVLYTLKEKGDALVRDTGNSVRMTVNEMAETIRTMTKSKARVKHLPMRLGENQAKPVELLPGPTAADLLGLTAATTPLEQGMAATVEYYASLSVQAHEAVLAFYYGRRAA